MKIKGLFPALALTLNAAIALPSLAGTLSLDDYPGDLGAQALSPKAKQNKNLDDGEYVFAKAHVGYSSSFFDEWQFTLAQDADVSISLFDLKLPGLGGDLLAEHGRTPRGADRRHHHAYDFGHRGPSFPDFSDLIGNKYLTVSLFDRSGNLLGTAGANGSLTALDLVAGEWYTLTVSGKVNGLLGSLYYGRLDVTPVPLGDSLPLLGSALAVLVVRRGRQIAARKKTDAA